MNQHDTEPTVRDISPWLDNRNHSVKADPKPRRVKDPNVYVTFHALDWKGCLHCGRWPIQAAHLLGGRRREDVLEGLIPLCLHCHAAFDGRGIVFDDNGNVVLPDSVNLAVHRYLTSDAGADGAAYLIRRLGPFMAHDYVRKLEAA